MNPKQLLIISTRCNDVVWAYRKVFINTQQFARRIVASEAGIYNSASFFKIRYSSMPNKHEWWVQVDFPALLWLFGQKSPLNIKTSRPLPGETPSNCIWRVSNGTCKVPPKKQKEFVGIGSIIPLIKRTLEKKTWKNTYNSYTGW